jgi:hypothetical protein
MIFLFGKIMTYTYSPIWFYGVDTALDLITIITCIMIGYFSIKSYNLNNNKSFLYFGIAFYLMSVGYIIQNLTYLSIYFQLINNYDYLVRQVFVTIDIIYIVGIFFYKFLTLLALLILFLVTQKVKSRNVIILLLFITFIFSMISIKSLFFYHLFVIGILAFIVDYYYTNYNKQKTKGAFLVKYGFLLFLLSQFIALFIIINPFVYVISEFIQMLSFFLLLIAQVKVLKK